MNKWILLMFSFFASLFGCGSDSNCYTYRVEENQKSSFDLKFDEADSSAQKLKLMCYLFGKKSEKPWMLQVQYQGEFRHAKRIETIELILSDPKNPGKTISCLEKVISQNTKNHYYFDPLAQPSKTRFADYLYPGDRNKETTINYFYVDFKYPMNTIPENLQAQIVVKWDTGSSSFDTRLKRHEEYGSKPSNRPFG